MPPLVTNPKDLATKTLAWLDQSSGAAANDDTCPLLLRQSMDQGLLTTGEQLGLWCYIQLASLLEPVLVARAARLRQPLCVEEAFVHRVRERGLALFGQGTPRPTVAELLAHPPAAVVDLVTELVADHVARTRPAPRALPGLEAPAYQHPMDRAFLNVLQAIPGLSDAIARLQDEYVRAQELRLLGNGVHVTAASVPGLYNCYQETCTALNVTHPPQLYIEQGGINAYTTGDGEPIIVVSPALADLLDRNEIMFVLGHELGHVLSGHGRYRGLARFLLEQVGGKLGVLGSLAGVLTSNLLLRTFFAWHRRSEFTADRAGFLACQNREAALRVLIKLIGYPVQAYDRIRTRSILEQAARYRAALDNSLADRLMELESSLALTHPLSVARAAELVDWIDDGGAAEILEASPEGRAALARRTSQDPRQQALLTTTAQALARWAGRHFGVPRAVAGPIVRHMIYEKRKPTGTALEPLLRIELHVTKVSVNQFRYEALALVRDAGRAAVVTLQVPYEQDWEDAPKEVRAQSIAGEAEQVLLLYTA